MNQTELIFILSRELAALLEIHYEPEVVAEAWPEAYCGLREVALVLDDVPDSVSQLLQRLPTHN